MRNNGLGSFTTLLLVYICITATESFSLPLRKSLISSSTSSHKAPHTASTLLMGLYDEDDEDLPDLPTDYISKRRTRDDIRNQKLQSFVNTDNYLPEEKDDMDQILPDADISSSSSEQHLFEWNLDGSEKEKRLPDLTRSLSNGIPCYFEASDKKVQIVMEKTECCAHDACWALEAHEGKIMEAMIDIAIAQRNVLNEAVALPDQDEVANTDWDEELKKLNSSGDKKKLDLGEEFEQAGYSIGMDGLKERKETLRNRDKMNEFKRLLDSKEDQDWIPGKQNPKPFDDEPWFTG